MNPCLLFHIIKFPAIYGSAFSYRKETLVRIKHIFVTAVLFPLKPKEKIDYMITACFDKQSAGIVSKNSKRNKI